MTNSFDRYLCIHKCMKFSAFLDFIRELSTFKTILLCCSIESDLESEDAMKAEYIVVGVLIIFV